MSIHDGHRQRLKDRFRKEGLENFEELYVLELLLFYCVPRQDTNEIAHRLLERFGSIVGVLVACPAVLEQVKVSGEGIITFLSLRSAVERYYQIKKAQQKEDILHNLEDCTQYMMGCFHEKRNETVYLLCMDAKCKVLGCTLVGEGSVNSAGVPIRRIVEMSIRANATAVVLAHNHPSGLALPSADDIQTTYRLAHALEAVDINLVDHLVYTSGDCVSIAQSGYYKPVMPSPW